jgi:site-specific DNA-methyltransferase (adenine-specific)
MPETTLHHADAIQALQGLEAGSVDAAVFDPPYKVISGGSNDKEGGEWSRPSGMLTKNDGKIFEHNDIDAAVYLPEVHRVLREDAHLYLMTNTKGLVDGDLLNVVRAAGFRVHSILTWRKNNATPNRWYMKDMEWTIFARKGKAFSINKPGSRASLDVFPHPMDWDNVRPGEKAHPTEKPVNLMRTYIENSTQPGEVVLDPFMGAGSTGVAAQELGRGFIGVEMSDEYFTAAQDRLGVRDALGIDAFLGCPSEDDNAFLG